MENYRKKLKIDNLFLLCACLVLALLQVLAICRIITPVTGDSHWLDMWSGFIVGASFGLMALFLIGIFGNLRALKNEARLKKLYIRETDERTRQVALLGKSSGNSIFLIAGLVAGIISGYFSITVCLTIIACVLADSVISVCCKLYYQKKI